MDVDAELKLFQAPAKLVEHYPDHPVIYVPQIAGEQLVGHSSSHRRSLELLPHEVRIVVTSLRRLGELYLLAWQQLLHGARLQSHHRREAVTVHTHRSTVDGIDGRQVAWARPSNESGEQIGYLLAEQHRIVEVVQRAQPQ